MESEAEGVLVCLLICLPAVFLIDSGLFEVAQSQHALNLLPAELRKFVDNDGFNQLYYRCCWEKGNSLTSTERNSYTAAS